MEKNKYDNTSAVVLVGERAKYSYWGYENDVSDALNINSFRFFVY